MYIFLYNDFECRFDFLVCENRISLLSVLVYNQIMHIIIIILYGLYQCLFQDKNFLFVKFSSFSKHFSVQRTQILMCEYKIVHSHRLRVVSSLAHAIRITQMHLMHFLYISTSILKNSIYRKYSVFVQWEPSRYNDASSG